MENIINQLFEIEKKIAAEYHLNLNEWEKEALSGKETSYKPKRKELILYLNAISKTVLKPEFSPVIREDGVAWANVISRMR